VEAIWSSPLVRALQTAHIVGGLLDLPVKVVEELASGATLKKLQAHFEKAQPLPERLMLVGHEPDCGLLIGELIGDAGSYALKKAGVAYLVGTFKPGGMSLVWKVEPKQVL
jgi:phosphohistidine phosphatase